MDIHSTKYAAFAEAAPEPKKSQGISLGDFSINFEDLISKAGANLGKDANVLASRSGLASVTERVDQPAPSEKYDYERNDDAPKAERADQNDDQHANSYDDHAQENRDSSQRDDNTPQDSHANQDAAAGNNPQDISASESQSSEGDNSNQAQSSNADTANQETAPSDQGNGQNAEQSAAGEQQSEEVLSALLETTQNTAPGAQVQEQASNAGAQNTQDSNASEGQAKTVAAVGQQNSSREDTQGLNTNLEKSLADTHGKGAEQLPQEKLQAQAKEASAANASSTASQQAENIAKMAGAGARINVNVTTTGEGGNVVSQPNSNLGASAILAGDGAPSQQSGQQPSQNHAGANANPTVHAAPPVQAQSPQMAQQVAAAASADAKGPAQVAQVSNSGAQATQTASADASLTTGANTTSESSQSQKSATTQANNTHQANQANQQKAVFNQVSVQINKAVKAGLDKINIQLRPDNLGRVEVRLEINQEGRTQASVIADNKEALELLQRDAKELVRSLQESGLDLENNDLSFSLREQQEQAEEQKNAAKDSSLEDNVDSNDADIEEDPLAAVYDSGIIEDGRIDIRA